MSVKHQSHFSLLALEEYSLDNYTELFLPEAFAGTEDLQGSPAPFSRQNLILLLVLCFNGKFGSTEKHSYCLYSCCTLSWNRLLSWAEEGSASESGAKATWKFLTMWQFCKQASKSNIYPLLLTQSCWAQWSQFRSFLQQVFLALYIKCGSVQNKPASPFGSIATTARCTPHQLFCYSSGLI